MATVRKPITVEGDKGFFSLFPGFCKGCGLCIEKCPKDAIEWSETLGVYGTPAVDVDMEKCIACGICQTVCPDCAIAIEKKKA